MAPVGRRPGRHRHRVRDDRPGEVRVAPTARRGGRADEPLHRARCDRERRRQAALRARRRGSPGARLRPARGVGLPRQRARHPLLRADGPGHRRSVTRLGARRDSMPDRPLSQGLGPERIGMIGADLASARWFRSKQRPIASVAEVDRTALGPGALTVVEVAFADGGGPERYLVPEVDGREPADGEGLWSALAEAIGREERIGPFVASRAPGFSAGALTERRLRVEQSNTSVVLGERLILKVYRLLEAGANPDVEVSAFLAGAGFADTPTLAGSVAYEAGRMHASAAMLQAYV